MSLSDAEMSTNSPEMVLRIFVRDWTFECSPVSKRPGMDAWKGGAPLHFQVGLSVGLDAWTGFYSAGEGIAIGAAVEAMEANGGRVPAGFAGHKPADIRALAGYGRGRTVFQADAARSIRAWYRPGIMDIVGSLFSDASGMEPFADLRSWVDDMGMDFEHPADALDAFEGCRSAARFLQAACGDDFERLAELAVEL